MHVSKQGHSIFDKMTHTVIHVTQFFCTLREKSPKLLRRGRMRMRHEVDMHKKPKSYIVHTAFFALTNDACHTPRKNSDLQPISPDSLYHAPHWHILFITVKKM